MPINPEAVGATADPVEASWTSKDALALRRRRRRRHGRAGLHHREHQRRRAAGASRRSRSWSGWGRANGAMGQIGTFNPAMLVHGQQAVTLHRPIPVEGTATLTSKVIGIYDKGKAAVVVATETAVLADGEPLFTDTASVVHPRRGRLGRRPRAVGPAERAARARARPPGHVPDVARPGAASTGSPATATRSTRDPSFAAMGGFDRPILHGLCTYGFTGRALLHTLGGRDRRGSSTSRAGSRPRCSRATR